MYKGMPGGSEQHFKRNDDIDNNFEAFIITWGSSGGSLKEIEDMMYQESLRPGSVDHEPLVNYVADVRGIIQAPRMVRHLYWRQNNWTADVEKRSNVTKEQFDRCVQALKDGRQS
jgi:hypothetical protein